MKVVVGTDGSLGGLDALRWAIDLCRGRHDPADVVDLVHVYGGHDLAMPLFAPSSVSPPARYLVDHPGASVALETGTIAHRAELQEHYRHEAELLLVDAIKEVGGTSGVHVTTTAVPGEDSGRALVNHAEGADLLVVGARGHARVVSHLLGSVSTHCVNHAPCPVVVVRPFTRT